MSAIEYLRDMLEVLNRYVATLAAVAAGNIVPGAQMLEAGLASIIPIAIGFLAKQVGLGNVPEKIVELDRTAPRDHRPGDRLADRAGAAARAGGAERARARRRGTDARAGAWHGRTEKQAEDLLRTSQKERRAVRSFRGSSWIRTPLQPAGLSALESAGRRRTASTRSTPLAVTSRSSSR